MIEMSYLR